MKITLNGMCPGLGIPFRVRQEEKFVLSQFRRSNRFMKLTKSIGFSCREINLPLLIEGMFLQSVGLNSNVDKLHEYIIRLPL